MKILNRYTNELIIEVKKNHNGIYDLRYADLSSADLSSANLRYADLSYAVGNGYIIMSI